MRLCLFNAITDALRKVEKHNLPSAKNILQTAQQRTEEMYPDGVRTEKSDNEIVSCF